MSTAPLDYDGLMQANLARVFGERDASRRLKAIAADLCPGRDIVRTGCRGEGSRCHQSSCEKRFYRTCRLTSPFPQPVPRSVTTVSEDCAGNRGPRMAPWP